MTVVQDLDESTFPAFVADLWERQGWTTTVREVDGEAYVAAVDAEAGERGLIWAKSGSTGARVTGSAVVEFETFCRENGVDDAAILTLGAFTEDGEAAAEKFDVELLDGDGLAAVVERHDLTDLVARHASDGDESESDDDGRFAGIAAIAAIAAVIEGAVQVDALGSPSELVAALRARIGDREIELPRQVGVATVVVVALVVAGVVVGPSFGSLASLDPLGGGDGGGEAPPIEVSAGPVQPGDAATTLYVEFDATATTTVDTDPDDDRVHVAPEGTRFVVVELSITNIGGQGIDLRPALFTLAADGTVYRYQPLAGVSRFDETTLEPDDSYEGWTVFVVPEDAPSGTLDVDMGAVRGGVAVQFAQNPGMTVNATA